MRYLTEQELYHHGILGQKWGVRRFQNQDGSYTAAGRERYGIEDGKRRSLKSYALEYKDRRENKNRYTRMKKNQNLDTMSFDEMKRLQEREALKGQIQWQQKQNDPNAWKKQLGREVLSTAARGLAEGASKELGKQLIDAPIKLAGYAGNKTISAASWSAREIVSVATDTRRQAAVKNTFNTIKDTERYLNNPGYRSYTKMAERNGVKPTWADYNKRAESARQQMASRKWNQEHNVLALPDKQSGVYSYPSESQVLKDHFDYRNRPEYKRTTARERYQSGRSTASSLSPDSPLLNNSSVKRRKGPSLRQKFNKTVWGNENGMGDVYEQAYYLQQPKQLRPLAYKFKKGL